MTQCLFVNEKLEIFSNFLSNFLLFEKKVVYTFTNYGGNTKLYTNKGDINYASKKLFKSQLLRQMVISILNGE